MNIAIVAFDRFNEIDVFVPFNILKRVKNIPWKVDIVAVKPTVQSMNGIILSDLASTECLSNADAVLIGSGSDTAAMVQNRHFIDSIELQPSRQLLAAQCSGALILQSKGLLNGKSVSVDRRTEKVLQSDQNIRLMEKPFTAQGNIATAGGCLSSPTLAAWIIYRLAGYYEAARALSFVAPTGQECAYIDAILAQFSN